MLLFFIVLYLMVTLLIGWWASRRVKTTHDFVVAGRKLPMLIAGTALFATWFGSETIMGASSEFISHGLIGVVEDPLGAALCLLLIGLFYARPLYRLNILTFNDFYRDRFGREAELISSVFNVLSYFGWIAAQMVALAILLEVIADIPRFAGVIIVSLVVMFYTYIGGMWAVSIADVMQTIVIILGLAILGYVVVVEAGGVGRLIKSTPPGFFNIAPKGDFYSIVHYVAAWITIGLGSIPQQDIFQRVNSARSERAAVHASYFSGLLYVSIAFIPLGIGLGAKLLYPELLEGDTQMVIPMMVLEHGNLFTQVLLLGALLSAILSTSSGAILAPATILGENIIRPLIPGLQDAQMLRIMRYAVVLITLISAGLAISSNNIYDLVAQASSLSLVSLFVPLTAGLYLKSANNSGALWSMILGMGVWIYFEIFPVEIPSLILGLLASMLGMLIGMINRLEAVLPEKR